MCFVAFGFNLYVLCLYSTNWKPDLPIFNYKPDGYVDYLVFILNVTFFEGAALSAKHEIMHRPDTFNKSFATFFCMLGGLGHFEEEHNQNHHKNVGTPLDWASSRLGDSFYFQFPREVIGGYLHTWERNALRLEKKYGQKPSLLTNLLENRLMHYRYVEFCIFAAIYMVFGMGGLKVQLTFVFIEYLTLGVLNYPTHYGIKRR